MLLYGIGGYMRRRLFLSVAIGDESGLENVIATKATIALFVCDVLNHNTKAFRDLLCDFGDMLKENKTITIKIHLLDHLLDYITVWSMANDTEGLLEVGSTDLSRLSDIDTGESSRVFLLAFKGIKFLVKFTEHLLETLSETGGHLIGLSLGRLLELFNVL